MAKILKCDDCGSIIQVLVEDDGDTCDTHMLNIPVQTEGEKAPKHKPVVEIDGDKVTVKVGEAAHPMDDDHYIQFLVVEAGAEQYAKSFKPGDVAEELDGLPPIKMHCSNLAADGLQAAIENYKENNQ